MLLASMGVLNGKMVQTIRRVIAKRGHAGRDSRGWWLSCSVETMVLEGVGEAIVTNDYHTISPGVEVSKLTDT